MAERLARVTFLVREYDEAVTFFTSRLAFALIEDSAMDDGTRWVVVAPTGSTGMQLVLTRASTPEDEQVVGRQTGGRVGFFLDTDDFSRTYDGMRARGVEFVEAPRTEPHGVVAVFADLYGNRWDLVQPALPGPVERKGRS